MGRSTPPEPITYPEGHEQPPRAPRPGRNRTPPTSWTHCTARAHARTMPRRRQPTPSRGDNEHGKHHDGLKTPIGRGVLQATRWRRARRQHWRRRQDCYGILSLARHANAPEAAARPERRPPRRPARPTNATRTLNRYERRRRNPLQTHCSTCDAGATKTVKYLQYLALLRNRGIGV